MKLRVLATLLTLAWGTPVGAEAPLGRLFHTPEERAQGYHNPARGDLRLSVLSGLMSGLLDDREGQGPAR